MSLISALILTVILILVLKRLNKGYRFFNQLPGPKCYPIIGNILDVIRLNQAEVFEFTRKCCAKYGTFRFWSLGIYHIGLSRTKGGSSEQYKAHRQKLDIRLSQRLPGHRSLDKQRRKVANKEEDSHSHVSFQHSATVCSDF